MQMNFILLDADLVPVKGLEHVINETGSTIQETAFQNVRVEEVDPRLTREVEKQALQKAASLEGGSEEPRFDFLVKLSIAVSGT
jgi:hypothetical protein